MIYADNAATTRPSPAAVRAMATCMEQFWGNPSSLHTPGQLAAGKLRQARETVAACIGAGPREIYFTSGGSEADNWAIRSAAYLEKRHGKTHLISTAIEHHAVLRTLESLAREGFEVTLLHVDDSGIVKVKDLAAAIRPDTALVTVMFANNEMGAIQPVDEIGALCREKNILFHTDAVQAAGHLPIDVKTLHADMLSLSAHKFHGPRGVGALYVRKGTPLLPLIQGGAQERGKRAGTENLPAIAGMAAALRESCEHMEENAAYVASLRDRLIAGLSQIPGAVLNGGLQNRLPGNVSFCFEGAAGESVLLLLDRKGICASSGSACASGSLDPSHVLLAMGRPYHLAKGALRLSPDESNTVREADEIIAAVTEIVAHLRK